MLVQELEAASANSFSPPSGCSSAVATGPSVARASGDNAGVVSIGDGLAVAFKLESHNHPSAVEPYQGAATGVGGILRDIFAMGARPVAVLDALRFGDPRLARTRQLVRGVVHGVGGYGNCVGVPTVGGELVFHPGYAENPLVNVMAVGVLEERHLTCARSRRDRAISACCSDRPPGATASAARPSWRVPRSTRRPPQKRPSVQVGDPFAEKLLIEASLELIERQLIEGLQDLGAAGITCAVSETADRGGTGICVDLDAIPRREEGMAPFEVMISESQERMLAIVRPDRLDAVAEVCRRWGLPAAVIGRVTTDGLIRVIEGGVAADGEPLPTSRELARISAAALTSDAIVHQRIGQPPAHRRAAPAPGAPDVSFDRLPERGMDPGLVLQALLGHPNVASRRWVTTQYDATVGADTLAGSDLGAATLRIKGTPKAIVMATDANERVGALDPWLGAATAVAECTRNVSITGATPLGITNCLNFGNPERPEAFWQLTEAVRGIADACRALGLPVTGGNVSLYNESGTSAILPTTQIGVVGLLDDAATRVGPAFRGPGEVIGLCGDVVPGLGGSIYADVAGQAPEDGPPAIDLQREAALQSFMRAAAAQAPAAFGAGRQRRWARRRARGVVPLRQRRRGRPAAGGRDARARAVRGGRCSRGREHDRRALVGAGFHRGRAWGAAATTGCHERGANSHPPGRRGRDRRSRGSRRGRRRRPRRVARRAAPRLGVGPAAGTRRGRMAGQRARPTSRGRPAEPCAASSASMHRARRPRRSPRSGSSRSSTADRSRPESPSPMVTGRWSTRTSAWSRRCSTNSTSRRSAASAPSRTAATPRPDRRCGRTASPPCDSARERPVALGHNGNLVNTRALLDQLPGGRSRLVGTSDTDLLTACWPRSLARTSSRRSARSCRASRARTRWS